MHRQACNVLRTGFLIYLQYVLRVIKGGLNMAGVPCSAHVWISRASTGKSRQQPLGDQSRPCTRSGNCIAARWALGVAVGIVRHVLWAAEQPSSSLLPRLPFVQFLIHINQVGWGFQAAQLVRLQLAWNNNNSACFRIS